VAVHDCRMPGWDCLAGPLASIRTRSARSGVEWPHALSGRLRYGCPRWAAIARRLFATMLASAS